MKKSIRPITTFIKIDVKRLFRDKVAIFFVFIFPIIFLVIFGSIFSGNNEVSFRVGLLNQSNSEFSKEFTSKINENKIFKVDKEISSLETAEQKMSRGQLDATIILPPDFGDIKQDQAYPSGQMKVVYNQSGEQAARTLTSIMEAILTDINSEFVESPTPFTVVGESTSTQGLKQFDYTFSGLLGFTLLSLGIFGPTTVFPRLKQQGVLRRYKSTTLKVWQYFIGNVVSNAIVGLISLVAMLAVAFTFFDLNMRGSYFNLAVIVMLGTILMFGIGLALGGWAKNENQAAPLAQVIALPMMFLSGVFFPTFLMPEFLQNITRFIPLTPVVDSIRLVITEGASLLSLGPQMAVIFAWLIAVYIIAFRVFRWE